MDLTIEGKAYINGRFENCCIGITNGRISAIKKVLKGDEHYNFHNKLIFPAGIDVHVHFRDPGLTHKEDFSSGTLAAAFGGVSCVFDMPNTIPQTTTVQNISEKIKIASKKTYVDFGVYAGITNNNINNINALAKKSSGFKIFMGDTTNSFQLNKAGLKDAFREICLTNKPVFIHAEDDSCINKHRINEKNIADHLRSRPNECEVNSINNILNAARDNKVKTHICHLSSCEGLQLLRDRKKNISVGVTPHHLLLTIENNPEPQTHYKVNPPIRTNFDREALFDGIKNSYIDVIESDHAPHTLDEKNVEFCKAPSGIPGVETMFPLFLHLAKQDSLSFQRLISLLCERPAEILNIPKGRIEVGRDADILVVDLKKTCKIKLDNLHSKCGWTPYEGWTAIFPTHLFVRGEKLIEDNELQVSQGFGRLIGA